MSIRATASDSRHSVIRLDDIAISRDDEGALRVCDNEQSLQSPENPIRSPIFSQFHVCPEQISTVLVQLLLKLRKKSEGICGSSCKTRQNFIMVNLTNLPGGMLHDGMFKRHLTISCHDHLPFMSNR